MSICWVITRFSVRNTVDQPTMKCIRVVFFSCIWHCKRVFLDRKQVFRIYVKRKWCFWWNWNTFWDFYTKDLRHSPWKIANINCRMLELWPKYKNHKRYVHIFKPKRKRFSRIQLESEHRQSKIKKNEPNQIAFTTIYIRYVWVVFAFCPECVASHTKRSAKGTKKKQK